MFGGLEADWRPGNVIDDLPRKVRLAVLGLGLEPRKPFLTRLTKLIREEAQKQASSAKPDPRQLEMFPGSKGIPSPKEPA
jgi:hypothetical protein